VSPGRSPDPSTVAWARTLAESERDTDGLTRMSREMVAQRRQQFARAATAMLSRLHGLFESATAAFNHEASGSSVEVAPLKGTGFVVSRGARRLTVVKTSDWNVVFSFSTPPKIDHVALLSRIEGNGIGWRLYRKADDSDKLEAAPREPGDLADVVVRRLFTRLIDPRRGRRR
jgi:hypothetical protein